MIYVLCQRLLSPQIFPAFTVTFCVTMLALSGIPCEGADNPRTEAPSSAQPAADVEKIARIKANAQAGEATSQCALALCYHYGYLVPRDVEQSAIWFRRAADQDDAQAQFMLGLMYAAELGLSRDDRAAVMWLRRAQTNGLSLQMARREFGGKLRVLRNKQQQWPSLELTDAIRACEQFISRLDEAIQPESADSDADSQ